MFLHRVIPAQLVRRASLFNKLSPRELQTGFFSITPCPWQRRNISSDVISQNQKLSPTNVSMKQVVDKKLEEEDRLYRSIAVECRGVDNAVLRSYSQFVSSAASHLDITLESLEFPRYHIKRWDVLKSVFIYKKHRVQYEVRTYFAIFRFIHLTSSTADTFLEYIQRNLPEGVSMKVTKEELFPLPKFVKKSDEIS